MTSCSPAPCRSAACPGFPPRACTAAGAHAVKLPIEFAGGGAGTTRALSPEEVSFATDRALGVGQRIEGTVRFPPALGGSAPALLHFAARVVEVARVPQGTEPGAGAFDVRARFERLEFAPPAPDGR